MKRILLASLAVISLPCLADPLPLQDASAEYARQTADCKAGDTVTLGVALDESPLEIDGTAGRLRIRYGMGFNHVTEGWNWHPEVVPHGGDYYTYKYLPLGSQVEEKGRLTRRDADGIEREYVKRWQYDYFFTFDNPADFYALGDDEHAGFAAELELAAADAERLRKGDLRMALRGQLTKGCTTESTTYWSGLPAKPVDFTLKKRYLIGQLSEVFFYDVHNGNVLARLTPRQSLP